MDFFQVKLSKSILSDNSLLGEVQHNPDTTWIFNLPASVWLVYRTKTEKINILPLNMMLIYIFYHIILILGDSVLLGGFKLGDKAPGVYGVDAKFIECISDDDFILYDRHECLLELVMRHVELLWWTYLGGWIK